MGITSGITSKSKVVSSSYSQEYKSRIFMLWYSNGRPSPTRLTKMIDEDDPTLVGDIVTELKLITEVHAIRQTVTGYAVIIEACDARGVIEIFKDRELDFQRDSMLFVEQWKGTETP